MFNPINDFIKPLSGAYVGNVIFIENRQTHYDSLKIKKSLKNTNNINNYPTYANFENKFNNIQCSNKHAE